MFRNVMPIGLNMVVAGITGVDFVIAQFTFLVMTSEGKNGELIGNDYGMVP